MNDARHVIQGAARKRQWGWSACLTLGCCLVFLVGGVLFWVTYAQQRNRREAQFRQRAVQHARGISAAKVAALSGSQDDLDTPGYRRLKRHLQLLRQAEPDCRFLYLMRRQDDGTVIILLDSEPPDSPDYSPPGDVYVEAGPDEEAFFSDGLARVFPPETDRWGTWVSAYAPVRDPDSGVVVALFGMDIEAADWQAALYRKLRWPLLIVLFLLAGVLTVCGALRRRQASGRPACWLMRHGEFIAIGATGVLLTGFAAWVSHGMESRRIFDAFNQIADSDLDRVQQRLEQLRDFSLPYVDRYLQRQTEFDPDQFGEWVAPLLARPGEHSWGWVTVVPQAERVAFEEQHAARFPGIWQQDDADRRRRATPRPIYYALTSVHPLDEVGEALGFDLGSEPRRLAAIEDAVATRLATASRPLELAIDAPEREALMIIYPVFAETDADRLLGLIATPLDIRRLVRRIWGGERLHYSVAALHPDTNPVMLYNNCPHRDHPLYEQQVKRHLGIFGQVLRLEAHPGPEFYGAYRRRAALWTLVVGLLTTGAVVVVLGTPLRRRRALEELVRDRTVELRASQEQYELLAHHSHTFRWEVDDTGRYTDVSDNVAEIIGYTPDELVDQKTFFDLAPPEDREQVKQHAFELMRTQQINHSYENRLVDKEGRIKWVLTTALPKVDAQGRVIGCFGWDSDITARKAAEAEQQRLLGEAERSRRILLSTMEDQQQAERERTRLATAIEQSPETVVITDAEGTIEYANPAFERTSGYSVAEAIGQNPRILKSGEQDPAFYADMWQTVATGQVWSGQVVNRHKSGRLFTEEATISPIRDEAGQVTHYVAIKRDITEELERERMYQQAQKMDSIGRLAGGIAHDFNNMLQVILGNTELAMESAGDNELLQQDLGQVKSAAKRSVELTRHLLAFASRQSVKPEIIDLHEAMPQALHMLQRLLDANIELKWQPGGGGGPTQIKMDPTQLDQLLVNLCVNARDAIEGHGHIILSTVLTVLSGKEMLIGEFPRPGHYVVLSLEDNGCGIEQELVSKIFEPFFTTKKKGQGTGLGLSTVYGILKQNGGYVDVESVPGQGTKFNLYFPLCEDPAVQVLEDQVVPAADRDAGILVVEDEADILRIAERALQKLGYRVRTADTPQRALDIIKENGGDIELLLTDVIMPGMNGKELAEQAVSLQPKLNCLFMSGYSEEVIAQNGIVPNETNFLQKPFTVEDLAAAVRNALQRKA